MISCSGSCDLGGKCLLCLLGVLFWLGVLPSVVSAQSVPSSSLAAGGGQSGEAVVEQTLAGMSLEEKVGQMVMIGIQGTVLDAASRQQLQAIHAGGVILYDPNMQTREQVRQLNQQLQQEYGNKIPLFLGVDEEGGRVARMTNELTPPLSEEALGRTGHPLAAKASAVQTARALKALGFNLNFAPVADVGSGRERSFSTAPAIAADFVEQAAGGYEQEKMLYTLKHFPGIGKGHADTHLDRVVVDAPLEQLQTEDLLPFQRVLQKYPQHHYLVMVSHVLYTAIDAENPASLSWEVQTRLLRNQLGYQGIIITDAMEMGALSKYYSFAEMGVKAVQAGVDILLVCHGYDHERTVYESVLQAVRKGTIPEQRIDASVRRILQVKYSCLEYK